jgi:hypothetical protein
VYKRLRRPLAGRREDDKVNSSVSCRHDQVVWIL